MCVTDATCVGGHNCIPFQDGNILFLDTCSKSGDILHYEISSGITRHFDVLPVKCNNCCVLSLINRTPAILHFPDNYKLNLTGISMLQTKDGSFNWELHAIVATESITCAYWPIFAMDRRKLYFVDSIEQPWKIRVLETRSETDKNFYHLDEKHSLCLNADFIRVEANANGMADQRPVIVAAAIINSTFFNGCFNGDSNSSNVSKAPCLCMLYSGAQCYSFDIAPVHRTAIYNFATKKWLKYDLKPVKGRPCCPNFSALSVPTVHYYDNAFWQVNVGPQSVRIYRLDLPSLSWSLFATFQMPNFDLTVEPFAIGSTITPDGQIHVCYKQAGEQSPLLVKSFRIN